MEAEEGRRRGERRRQGSRPTWLKVPRRAGERAGARAGGGGGGVDSGVDSQRKSKSAEQRTELWLPWGRRAGASRGRGTSQQALGEEEDDDEGESRVGLVGVRPKSWRGAVYGGFGGRGAAETDVMGRGIWPREGIERVDAFSQWEASRRGLNHVGSGPMSWLECRPLMRAKCSVQRPMGHGLRRPPAPAANCLRQTRERAPRRVPEGREGRPGDSPAG